ncbi:glutathione S-transferase GST-6.0 [mine drainage metagenome]|uniref:Glutathione S-transferase GST-6.0 n=1 Tax=mine drainage metagenome TaxID=410659 RepID=A0A1J5RYG8_9ZZZZ
MKLYYYPGACSLAVDIALREAGQAFEMEKVDLKSKITESGIDYRRVNARGYVPALRLDNERVLTEVGHILLWVGAHAKDKAILPDAGSDAYFAVVEYLFFIATELHKGCGPLFNPHTPEAVRKAAHDTLTLRVSWLNDCLGTNPFIVGPDFTVADAYLFTVLSWLPRLGFDYGQWPALEGYLARVGKRPCVQAALKAEGLLPA